jgi:type IV pilus assembly protein PilV
MNKLKQNGFTLIEVLVTLVIMAVGMLGLAGMQATSLKNTESSYQRSQATIMAYDMLDRMRANSAGVDSGSYNSISTTAAGGTSNCGSVECDPSAMAGYDDAEWHAQLASLLPAGTGSVAGSGTDSLFTITVTWDDNLDGEANTSFTLSSRI